MVFYSLAPRPEGQNIGAHHADMEELTGILSRRLQEMGIESFSVRGFIRDLSNIIQDNPYMGLRQINKRLQSLGWDHLDLDDHSLQLALASLESDSGFMGLKLSS